MNLARELEDNQTITFNEKHSLAIRIWHWTTFITIAASLVLVLLGSTMFKIRDNVGMVQEQLERKGAIVTKDQARAVAHEYSDKIWMAHKLVGYVLCFLLLTRFILEFAQPGDEKIGNRIRRAMGISPDTQAGKGERIYYLRVKWMYLIFYFLFFLMAMTGLGLAFEDVPMLRAVKDPLETVHKFVQYLIYSYILIHLIGVISADAGKYKGIVSGMIHKIK